MHPAPRVLRGRLVITRPGEASPSRFRRPRWSVRVLMLAVAFVALAIAWSSRWTDYRYRAAFHATLAAQHRDFAGVRSMTAWARDRQQRKAEWHEEMGRRALSQSVPKRGWPG